MPLRLKRQVLPLEDEEETLFSDHVQAWKRHPNASWDQDYRAQWATLKPIRDRSRWASKTFFLSIESILNS